MYYSFVPILRNVLVLGCFKKQEQPPSGYQSIMVHKTSNSLSVLSTYITTLVTCIGHRHSRNWIGQWMISMLTCIHTFTEMLPMSLRASRLPLKERSCSIDALAFKVLSRIELPPSLIRFSFQSAPTSFIKTWYEVNLGMLASYLVMFHNYLCSVLMKFQGWTWEWSTLGLGLS